MSQAIERHIADYIAYFQDQIEFVAADRLDRSRGACTGGFLTLQFLMQFHGQFSGRRRTVSAWCISWMISAIGQNAIGLVCPTFIDWS